MKKSSLSIITVFTVLLLAGQENPGPRFKTKIDTAKLAAPVRLKNIYNAPGNLSNLINARTCTDLPPVSSRPLPPRAATNAATYIKIDANGNIAAVAVSRQPLATYTEKMWEPGEVITVGFNISGGSLDLIEKVKYYAKEWELYANIRFAFQNNSNGMIRVGFQPGGSASLIGRDALLAPANQTTMNFGWLATTTDASQIRQVILHEFGHALGFIHEHQSTGTAIPWDREKVYTYYAQPPNNWSRAQVDQNIFNKFSYTSTNYSSFDPYSIMLYPVPAELTTDGSHIDWNGQLSAVDKQYAALYYPFPALPPPARGTLKTGDDCDEIGFTVEYGVVPRDKVEFYFELGQQNGKAVTWWKQIGIPLKNNNQSLLEIQNHSLIASENKTSASVQLTADQLDKYRGISFAKAKALGIHTPLSYTWNVLPAISGGCRVRLSWKKDSCL